MRLTRSSARRAGWRLPVAATVAVTTMASGLTFFASPGAALAACPDASTQSNSAILPTCGPKIPNCPDLVRGEVAVAVCTPTGVPVTPPPVPTAPGTPTPGPSVPVGDIGVVIGDDGWITYTKTKASTLPLIGAKTQTVVGAFDTDGNCEITTTGDSVSGAAATYTEDVAYNPTTCQAKIVVGGLSAATVASLSDVQDVPNKAEATDSVAAGPDTSPDSGTGVDDSIGGAPGDSPDAVQNASSANAAKAATRYASAYEKTSWIDPLYITITSLTTNLKWPLYGAGGTLYGRNNPYKFRYDGWSSSGTPPVKFKTLPGNAGWSINAAEQFVNNDFAAFIYATMGMAGWLACGAHLTTTAKFNHNVTTKGYRSGSRGWAYSDKKSGACSNLVHHGQWNGSGWAS
jgi:hypothetical protein